MKELELVALTQAEVRQFARAYFGEEADHDTGRPLADEILRQTEQNPAMLGLAQTPLLLTLICVAFAYPIAETSQGLHKPRVAVGTRPRLPATRCELYAQCLRGLLGLWPHARRSGDTGYDPEGSPGEGDRLDRERDLLAEVAWQLSASEPEHTLFDRAELRAALESEPALAILAGLGWTTSQALDRMTQDRGVLTRVGAGDSARYLFLHRTFQEYLLAWALGRRWQRTDQVQSHVFDPSWRIVLALMGGVLEQQESDLGRRTDRVLAYLQVLLRENAQDVLCRPFQVAALAVRESRTGLVAWNAELSDLITRILCLEPCQVVGTQFREDLNSSPLKGK